MSLINSLENRFGRHAIPGLVAIIAWFQVAVWILIKLRSGFADMLDLNPALVLHGEVWRLITWIFIPTMSSPLWFIFAVMIMLMISEALDHAWGPFRVNLYVLGGAIFMIMGAMLFNSPPSGLTLYTGIFLAFAVIAPDFEFLLFFILPVKAKWLGALSGAGLLLSFISVPPARLPILFSLMNFFIAFGPGFIRWLKQRGTVVERRARFESTRAPEGSWLHKCHACGKTDLDDPKLDFRVGADGEDYCNVCRPKKQS
jgi:hypothetical protein